jgi:predicted nucleic acid-binding protein
MSMVEAESELARVKEVFTLLGDEEGILQEWERLVIAHQVRGKTSHDARLVAAMHRHGLTHLLTFNASHFNRFPGITVVTPEEVLQAGS